MSPIYVQIIEKAYPFRMQLPISFPSFSLFCGCRCVFFYYHYSTYITAPQQFFKSIYSIVKFAVSLLLPLVGDAIAI